MEQPIRVNQVPIDPRATCAAPRPTVVDSRDLFHGRQELQIQHQGEVYRLRVTRNGRLILNK